ncbi:MAG: Na+/H+ antiporter NhaC family protein [Candidatus Babeliales bacterium]|nr:Na+/H+ antiporter NhaC family protein [Candidatus Babeliales bacterium]
MLNNWPVLLPPCIVLLCAFITHRLNSALVLGIVSAAFIAVNFSFYDAASLTGKRIWQTVSDSDNLYLYTFLIVISIIIVLLNRTGGAFAFATALTKRLRSKKMAETSSLMLSLTLFIDDYLNGLTIGYVMRPITDQFKIPRAKLAFLVQAMTSPLVILAPISSWGAALTGALEQAGITAITAPHVKIIGDPFFVYMQSIPYIFYSFLMIGSTWFIVHARISFGSMHTHERIAHTTGNLFGGKDPLPHKFEKTTHPEGSMADLLLPLISLISLVLIGSLWTGDYYLFGGSKNLLDAFKYNDKMLLILLISSIITLIISFIFAWLRNKIAIKHTASMIIEGFDLITSAIVMIILAATLGTLLKSDLLTGEYLATLLQGTLSASLLPLMFFTISTITAFITGSSWGTIMLLAPIAVPMIIAFTQTSLPATADSLIYLLPVIGAIFSGAVCGNHISPIADTTIMTATSSGSYPLDHAHTQFFYIAPTIISSAIAYLLCGLLANHTPSIRILIPLSASITFNYLILYVLNKLYKKQY